MHIRRHALETMIRASIETFKRECVGFVFGREPTKTRNTFIITTAVPLQCVRRLHTKLRVLTRGERRLSEFFSHMPKGSQPLGDFHSHTERAGVPYTPEMSEIDIEDMKQCQSKIEFIIGITSRKRGVSEWRVNGDGSVTGSFGSGRYNYNFDIRAYIPNKEEEKDPQQIKIVAPEAIRAFNRTLGYSS